jgi:MarR family transcriptional regulator, organic hydroperoxide resistance regulator
VTVDGFDDRPEGNGADAFLTAFEGLAQAVRRARGVPAQTAQEALTLSQYGLLQGLAEGGQARVVELANTAGVTPPTATRILDALERRGIVRRRRAPEDRRGVTITLTPNGRELLDTQHEWLRSRQEAFYAGLPAGERAVVADLLLRLAELIAELAPGPEGCS